MREHRAWRTADLPAALATLREALHRHRRIVLAVGIPAVVAAVVFAAVSVPFANAASTPSCWGSSVAKSTDGGAAVVFSTSTNKLTACDTKKDGRSAVGEWATSQNGTYTVAEVNDDGFGKADESDNAINVTKGQTIFVKACTMDKSAGETTPSHCGSALKFTITTTASGSGSSSSGSSSDTDTSPSSVTSIDGGAKATFNPTTGLLQICATLNAGSATSSSTGPAASTTKADAVVVWFTASAGLQSAHATPAASNPSTSSATSTASTANGNCKAANAGSPVSGGVVIVYFACTQTAAAHMDIKSCSGIKDTSALPGSTQDLTADLSGSSSSGSSSSSSSTSSSTTSSSEAADSGTG